MLILTRRVGESIRINDNVKVTIMDFNGHQIKIGIDAPKEVPIVREEISDKYDSTGKKKPGGWMHD